MNRQAETASALNGVILAGGKSSRFGSDKSQMELLGKRVMNQLAGVLRQFPFRNLAIITAKGIGGDWPAGALVIMDDQEGLGPAGGIATALRRLSGGILVTACDMPFVSAPLVEWLLASDDSDFDAVIPRHPGGIEPLLGIYKESMLPALEEQIRNGRRAIHAVLKKVKVRFADVPAKFPPERAFANINTSQDYERILRLLDGAHNQRI